PPSRTQAARSSPISAQAPRAESARSARDTRARARASARTPEARAAAFAKSSPRRVDLVERAAVGEMRRLRLLPAAERLVDREHRKLREPARVFRGYARVARAIAVLRGDFLALGRVEIFEVRLGDLARAALVDDLVDDADRRLGEDADRRRDDLEAL